MAKVEDLEKKVAECRCKHDQAAAEFGILSRQATAGGDVKRELRTASEALTKSKKELLAAEEDLREQQHKIDLSAAPGLMKERNAYMSLRRKASELQAEKESIQSQLVALSGNVEALRSAANKPMDGDNASFIIEAQKKYEAARNELLSLHLRVKAIASEQGDVAGKIKDAAVSIKSEYCKCIGKDVDSLKQTVAQALAIAESLNKMTTRAGLSTQGSIFTNYLSTPVSLSDLHRFKVLLKKLNDFDAYRAKYQAK